MPLSAQQQRFVEAYVANPNATQAAIVAGYSEHTAKQQGSRLLTNVDVSTAIRERATRIGSKYEVNAERVIAELAKVAFGDIRSVVNWDARGNVEFTPTDELTDAQTAAIDSFTVEKKDFKGVETTTYKVSMHNKLGALNTLAKLFPEFSEKHEITTDVRVRMEALTAVANMSPEQLKALAEGART